MKIFISSLFVIFLFFTATPQCYSKTYKIYDIDNVNIDSNFHKDYLRIGFAYYDLNKGHRVVWEKKNINCICVVYPVSDSGQINKVSIISERRFIEDSGENFFIKIPKKYSQKYNYGIVKCDLEAGWKRIQAEDYFEFKTKEKRYFK